MAVENLASELGNPGRFQMVLYLMLCCNEFLFAWNHLGMVFIGANTKHHCRVDNSTAVNYLVPMVNKGGINEWDTCNLFAGYNTTKKVPCTDGWTYYLPGREQTIIAQWDLVCDDAYKASLATTVYFCGVLLAGLVFGPLADTFGRRPIILLTMYLPFVIGLLTFLFQNYVAFVILRFLLGFVMEGLQVTVYSTIIEMFALKYRTVVGTVTSIFWSIGVMSLALVAYAIQDWKYIQLFTTMTSVLQIGLIWFSSSIGYYGITLNISTLAGNKYINFFIGGLLELISYIVTIYILSRFGRRKPTAFYLLVGAVMGISAGVLSEKAGDNESLQTLTTALAIVGKSGFSGAICVLFVYTAELFPTVIRIVGLGVCLSSARVGSLIVPQILYLGRATKSISFTVLGCCAFAASLLSLLLPETLNKDLTDTIDEEGKMKKNSENADLFVPCETELKLIEN